MLVCMFLKLGGFELARTETSLQKNKSKKNSAFHYHSPQQLQNINHPYDKACEIYRYCTPTRISNAYLIQIKDDCYWLYMLFLVLALSCGRLQHEVFLLKVCMNTTINFGETKKIFYIFVFSWILVKFSVPVFLDCSSHDQIYQKVYVEKVMEPLPTDCPQQLKELINACRSFEPFQRPTAGGKTLSYKLSYKLSGPSHFILWLVMCNLQHHIHYRQFGSSEKAASLALEIYFPRKI